MYVWWLSVMVKLVSLMDNSTGRYSLPLCAFGPTVWCVLSGVENCRTVNHALFAPQQALQWQEVLVE